MSGPITWKNVGSTVSPGSTSFQDAHKAFKGSFDGLNDLLLQQREMQAGNVEQLRTNRKNEYKGLFENAHTVDELNELRDSGAARAFREAGGFDPTGTFGLYGERLAQLNTNASNEYQHNERARMIAEAPIIARHKEILETQGRKAADAFAQANRESIADPGALYAAAEQEAQDDWKFSNTQNAAHQRNTLFRQGQDLRQSRIDAQNLVEAGINDLRNYEKERNNAVSSFAKNNNLPTTRNGEIDWDKLGSSNSAALRSSLDTMLEEQGLSAPTETVIMGDLEQRLRQGDLPEEDIQLFLQGAQNYYQSLTELKGSDQTRLNDVTSRIEEASSKELAKLQEEYAPRITNAFQDMEVGIGDVYIEAVDTLSDWEGKIPEKDWKAFWGDSSAEQVEDLQGRLIGLRSEGLEMNTGNGERTQVPIPRFVHAAALQQVSAAATSLGAYRIFNADLGDMYEDAVEKLMLRDGDKILDRYYETEKASRELEDKENEIKLRTEGQIQSATARALKDNGRINLK